MPAPLIKALLFKPAVFDIAYPLGVDFGISIILMRAIRKNTACRVK
jgi:hypothetical protein